MIRSCGSSGSSRSGRSHGVTARRLMLLVGRPGQFDPCQSVPPRSADQYDTLIRRCYPGSAETEGRAGQGRAGERCRITRTVSRPLIDMIFNAKWACFWVVEPGREGGQQERPVTNISVAFGLAGLQKLLEYTAARAGAYPPARTDGGLAPPAALRFPAMVTRKNRGTQASGVRSRPGCPTPVNRVRRMRPEHSQRSVRRSSASTDRHPRA